MEKQDRTITKEEYRFVEDGKVHIHELLVNGEWKPLIGISTVVKDITNFGIAAYYGSRRALMHLGYDPKEARNDVSTFRNKLSQVLDDDKSLVSFLYEAYKNHATYSKSRAVKGTNSHDLIDKWIKKCIEENQGNPLPSEEPIVKKFIDLTKHLQPKFIASEKHGYNKELWIGGITDVIVETNIGLGIWDNKDRPAIYGKDLVQMGGYTLLFPMEFTHVLGIPLEGNSTRIFYDIPQLQKAFTSQLEIYKFMSAVEPKDY